MAVKEEIYNNVSGGTSYVNVEFDNSILTADPSDANQVYYISFTPRASAKDTGGTSLPKKVATGLDDLALTGANVAARTQSATNTSNAYSDITALVADYMYDYINGHTANQFSSGVRAQLPLDF